MGYAYGRGLDARNKKSPRKMPSRTGVHLPHFARTPAYNKRG